MFQTTVVEKIKTFFFENRAIHKKMWKNIVERGSPQNKTWRMLIACWIPKTKNTHTRFV
jgi:hypothetical protein